MATAKTVAECDYVGIVSGCEVPDKLERCGFHAVAAEQVDAPVFRELPMALECRLKSYDPETGRLFGEIVSINADEDVLTDGKIELQSFARSPTMLSRTATTSSASASDMRSRTS